MFPLCICCVAIRLSLLTKNCPQINNISENKHFSLTTSLRFSALNSEHKGLKTKKLNALCNGFHKLK